MCDCENCDCLDETNNPCCNDETPHVMNEETGNVICDGVDCNDCCDILCMQVYDPIKDVWALPCGMNDCLTICGPECEHPIPQDGTNPVRPSGMPDPSGTYTGGVCPSGTTQLECGEVSLWFNHTFTATISYKIESGFADPWPWARNIMRQWSGKKRAEMENSYACEMVPMDKLKEIAEKAINDATVKFSSRFNCAACDNGNVCPKVFYAIWKPQTNSECKNGRLSSYGDAQQGTAGLNVTVTVTGTFKVCVYCYKARC